MNSTRATFNKSERLCSIKVISGLFETGNVIHTSLFKVVWAYSPGPMTEQAQVAFSVSKRCFRLAVTRNLIKRRLREAYRKNKSELYNHLIARNIKIVFVVILRGKEIPDYATTEKAMTGMISKLVSLIKPETGNPPSPKATEDKA
jgi:ribonuclease P protein component